MEQQLAKLRREKSELLQQVSQLKSEKMDSSFRIADLQEREANYQNYIKPEFDATKRKLEEMASKKREAEQSYSEVICSFVL